MSALILAACLAVAGLGAPASDFLYVSPTGDDGAAGTEVAPLRTLVGARDRLRARKASAGGWLTRPVTVVFADGVYPVPESVTFGPEDSGSAEAPVVYRAAHRGRATFDGGVVLKWRRPAADDPNLALVPAAHCDRVAVADLPDGRDLPGFRGGRGYANDCPVWLYANGRPLPIASWPNAAKDWLHLRDEFARIKADDEATSAHNKADRENVTFRTDATSVTAWAREPDAWAQGFWAIEWDDACSPVVGADASAGTVTIARKGLCYMPGKRGTFRMQNCLSEMDVPGEWTIDRKNRRVYLLYKKGLGEVRASWTDSVIVAKDLAHVTFDGFAVVHARSTALDFIDCRSVGVQGCTVSACGAWGLVFAGGAQCRAEGNDFSHLGEGGVAVSGGDRETLTPSGSSVVNNHIHHYGERLWAYRPGVSIGARIDSGGTSSVGCRVEHNLIHHSRHMGIGFSGNDNRIAFNVIHDVCAWTSDAGAIYGYVETDWSDMRGTEIAYNVVYMSGRTKRSLATEGIYLDGIVSGVTVRGNIVVGVYRALFQNGGQANVYERNIVASCRESMRRNDMGGRSEHTRADSPAWKNLQKNRARYESEPWRSRFPELARQAAMTDPVLAQRSLFSVVRDNVFAASGPQVYENRDLLAPYQAITNNLELTGDPGFVDYAGFDWNLKRGSAAQKLVGGTRFDEMGLFESPLRASPAVKFGADVSPVPPLGPFLDEAWVKIDVTMPRTFTVEQPMATNLVSCTLAGGWCTEHNRICGDQGHPAEDGGWRTYSFSFCPTVSGKAVFNLMGAHGAKTRIDDLHVTGCTLANAGFESAGGWSLNGPSGGAERRSDISRPYGLVAADARHPAAEGKRFAVVNHDLILTGETELTAGRRVTVTFKAAAW